MIKKYSLKKDGRFDFSMFDGIMGIEFERIDELSAWGKNTIQRKIIAYGIGGELVISDSGFNYENPLILMSNRTAQKTKLKIEYKTKVSLNEICEKEIK